MELTISAPMTNGTQIELTGQKRGPFLIHCSIDGWLVTHIETGMKFPWCFENKRKAASFASNAARILDWSSIKVKIVSRQRERKSKFVKGPTPEQTRAIFDLAKASGGMKIS
jgi:hypothetical protein